MCQSEWLREKGGKKEIQRETRLKDTQKEVEIKRESERETQ